MDILLLGSRQARWRKVFLWSQKSPGGHSALGVKTDIWVESVGYQQLVEQSLLVDSESVLVDILSRTGLVEGSLLEESELSWRTFCSWGQDQTSGWNLLVTSSWWRQLLLVGLKLVFWGSLVRADSHWRVLFLV